MVRLSNQSELLALLATLPSGAAIYPGTVPGAGDLPPKPVLRFPYVLVRVFMPRVTDRSLNRTVHARADRWRLTIVGLSYASVSIIETQCRNKLEGVRIGGQRVEEIQTSGLIDEDLDVTLSGSSHPFYTVQEWRVMR